MKLKLVALAAVGSLVLLGGCRHSGACAKESKPAPAAPAPAPAPAPSTPAQ